MLQNALSPVHPRQIIHVPLLSTVKPSHMAIGFIRLCALPCASLKLLLLIMFDIGLWPQRLQNWLRCHCSREWVVGTVEAAKLVVRGTSFLPILGLSQCIKIPVPVDFNSIYCPIATHKPLQIQWFVQYTTTCEPMSVVSVS